MRVYGLCRNLGFGIIGLVSGFSSAALAAVNDVAAPVSTPSGITLVDVTSASAGGGGGGVTTEWYYSRLGDSDGKPLYTRDKDGTAGKSTCVAECAKEFPPYRVAKGAVPFGAWSIVARADGTRQWAYQGRPLYRYSGVDPVSKAPVTTGYAAADARREALQDLMKLDGKGNSPKEGWRRAVLSTNVSAMPPEFDLKSISTANGYAFVVPATGHILYVFKTAPKDPANWTPAYAGALEKNVSDFSVVVRQDGKRQWAYKHQPLYTYNDDSLPDDINGLTARSDAQVALAFRNYMPAGLAITVLPFRGPIMVTAQGKTLYVQARYHNQFGGLENRGGFQYSYSDAKGVGTQACVDDCLKKWEPVVAPANAQPSGMWEIYTRTDGTRQWAYKGAALYTYADDKSPGDNKGNNIHEIVYGNGHNEDIVKLAGGDVRSVAGAGFYWHVVPFFN